MKTTVIVAMLLAFLPWAAGADSQLLMGQTFYSESLDMDRDFGIYLPDGYDPAGVERYPVIYFLHGAVYGYGIYWAYFEMRASLDNLIGSGQIEPVILVTPNGLIGPYDGSCWTNSEMYGAFEDYVVDDLVSHIDANYSTLPTRSFRGIQGLSTGGYGSMKIALKHTEVYRAVAAHSGELVLRQFIEVKRDRILGENAPPPYHYEYGAGMFTDDMFTYAGACSPNPENPYGVDLPYDEDGAIVDSVWDHWDTHCPSYWASQLPSPPWPPERDLGIYFDCGTLDEYLNYPLNVAFAESLDALGIPYEFRPFVGTHTNQFPQRFQIGVAHLDSVMWGKGPWYSGTEPSVTPLAREPRIAAISSPCSDPVRVCFELPWQDDIRIDVVDATGRHMRTLTSGVAPAGASSVRWRIDDDAGTRVPAGVYFVRMQLAGGGSAQGRILVVR